MATTDLVEGRIVFLCTEPKTIEPHASAWNALADALLASVHELGKVPALKSASPTCKSDGILLGLKVRQRSNPFLNLAICEQL